MIPQKRVVIYLPEEDYKTLKSALSLQGKTVSGWFREMTKQYLMNAQIVVRHGTKLL